MWIVLDNFSAIRSKFLRGAETVSQSNSWPGEIVVSVDDALIHLVKKREEKHVLPR
jgi:hypothetical protein